MDSWYNFFKIDDYAIHFRLFNNPPAKYCQENAKENKLMKQYDVDAFTDRVFHGNQAAVCVLDEWPGEELMMNITRENNFPEIA